MNDSFPFLYQHRLNDLIALPEKTIIQAGPGMGKSVFIEKLLEALNRDGVKTLFIKGSIRNKQEDIKEIIQWCRAEDNKGILLIDNLDHIYDSKLEIEFRNLNSADERIVIATSCTPTRAHFLGSELPGLNESFHTKNPTRLNTTMIGSLGLSSFASLWLSPWDGLWENKIPIIIQSVLDYHARSIATKPDKVQALKILNKEKLSIGQHILQISGGHPILLHRTINTFIRKLLSEGTEVATNEYAKYIDTVFSALIPTIIENCSPRIFTELDWAESILPIEVYRTTLKEVIQGDPPHHVNGIRVLRQAGILNKKNEKIGFVCKIIREVTVDRLSMLNESDQLPLVSKKETSHGHPKITLQPKTPDSYAGDIIYHIPNQSSKVVTLSPTEWEIIVYLEKNEGSIVTVNELIEILKPNSGPSIRSALQRLTGKLTHANIKNLVTNIPRKGYLYNTSNLS